MKSFFLPGVWLQGRGGGLKFGDVDTKDHDCIVGMVEEPDHIMMTIIYRYTINYNCSTFKVSSLLTKYQMSLINIFNTWLTSLSEGSTSLRRNTEKEGKKHDWNKSTLNKKKRHLYIFKSKSINKTPVPWLVNPIVISSWHILTVNGALSENYSWSGGGIWFGLPKYREPF